MYTVYSMYVYNYELAHHCFAKHTPANNGAILTGALSSGLSPYWAPS